MESNGTAQLFKKLRELENHAYSAVVSAFRAQGELTWTKLKILDDLKTVLQVSQQRHRAELVRVESDKTIQDIALHCNEKVFKRESMETNDLYHYQQEEDTDSQEEEDLPIRSTRTRSLKRKTPTASLHTSIGTVYNEPNNLLVSNSGMLSMSNYTPSSASSSNINAVNSSALLGNGHSGTTNTNAASAGLMPIAPTPKRRGRKRKEETANYQASPVSVAIATPKKELIDELDTSPTKKKRRPGRPKKSVTIDPSPLSHSQSTASPNVSLEQQQQHHQIQQTQQSFTTGNSEIDTLLKEDDTTVDLNQLNLSELSSMSEKWSDRVEKLNNFISTTSDEFVKNRLMIEIKKSREHVLQLISKIEEVAAMEMDEEEEEEEETEQQQQPQEQKQIESVQQQPQSIEKQDEEEEEEEEIAITSAQPSIQTEQTSTTTVMQDQ